MATIQRPPTPPDERQWSYRDAYDYYKPMHANGIHPYFHESPYFDHTTKNGLLFDQSRVNAELFNLVQNRVALEDRLRSMNGVEYMITGEPPIGENVEDTGVWVIRKQGRRKRQGREDEVVVLETYYMIGEFVYQAPPVTSLIGNRILSVTTSLSKFLSKASTLPLYTPATGYTYFPPMTPSQHRTSSFQPSQSEEASLEPSLAADSQPPDTVSQNSSVMPSSRPDLVAKESNDPYDEHALFESFNMMLRYGDEFTDENPLVGEPGKFIFSSTQSRIRAKAAEAAKAQPPAAVQIQEKKALDVAAGVPVATNGVAEDATADTKPIQSTRKASKIEKIGKDGKAKRRKSKHNISPTNPATPSPAKTPGAG
ncbi:Mediator of RNA polymerase II transcription subunit 6 [Elasticomyces elasticus]|nr:Mediator of RNA polymerase II transcription subunit 6 [Elasticomyces elasticus]KAK4997162.1 Mediator of RNA polymerase II transcription subunit 6 [Elasticomyces elasticus]